MTLELEVVLNSEVYSPSDVVDEQMASLTSDDVNVKEMYGLRNTEPDASDSKIRYVYYSFATPWLVPIPA